jgi:glucose-6-phosphate isomerase
MDNFEALLGGAHAVDEYFRTTPFEKNIPVIIDSLIALSEHKIFTQGAIWTALSRPASGS